MKALRLINVERHGAGAWLAKQTGTTVKAANKWLNGESQPRREKLEIISKVTGARSEWLAFGEGEITISKINEKSHRDSTYLGHVDVYESDEPLHSDEIEVPFFTEVELSAGNGFNNVSEIATQQMRFNLSTLSSAGVSPSWAACCKVSGDSMEPVLPDGSTVGIDTSDTGIKDGKMYAINHGGMLRVKFLYRTPFNGLRIRSANPDYHDEEVSGETAKDIRIIGRVFWYSVII
tara:strand:+ start:9881 stop:10582 length:702 start_codon:yes stop_codon:yes gene_type:complete